MCSYDLTRLLLEQFFEWIESQTNLEKITAQNYHLRSEYRLGRMQHLVWLFDNPQAHYSIIHVAGSKGKGSTANMLAEILAESGQKTGCFLSPHVSDWRERIQVKPYHPSDSHLLQIGEAMRSRCLAHYGEHKSAFQLSQSLKNSPPTTFELLTLWALLCFQELQCSWAVIECGLGGRRDATNIVDPQAAVITPIEQEHTQYLGRNLKQIATDKAGIIKRGRPLFVGYQQPEAMQPLVATAQAHAAPLYALEDYLLDCHEQRAGQEMQNDIVIRHPHKKGVRVTLSYRQSYLSHRREIENAALAALTILALRPTIETATISLALSRAHLPGRYETLLQQPPLLCDGAHTPHSVENITESFCNHFGHGGALLFGCKNDKEIDKMATIMTLAFSEIYLTSIPHISSAPPELLLQHFAAHATSHSRLQVIEDWKEIITKYLQPHPQKLKPLLICGSFYLAGAVRDMVAAYSH